ncbi:unnamed protein product [Bemisia tabaci]|uniref:Mitotic spindle assembly checkpoint protein MAD1 n=1 Tax=Bemisia tabaci TaxID=7038 RepID=A0A9P0F3W7_BEMTA|nr:unnamed protein product [Bemisia tabaci]
MAHEQEDPTCVIKMLDDFRAGCLPPPSRGLSSLNFPFRYGSTSASSHHGSKPMRLNFDDSEVTDCFLSARKRKLDSTNESIDSEGHKTMNESSIVASPWETRRIQGELLEARAQIAGLEKRLSQVHTIKRETEIMMEAEKNDITQALCRERKNVTELEKRLATVRKREAEVREELAQMKTSLGKKVANLEEKCQLLVIENTQFRDQVNELKSKVSESGGESGRRMNELESERSIFKEEAERYKQLSEELSADLKEKRKELRQWEMDKTKLLVAQQRIKDMEYEKESYQEAAALAKSQHTKLLKIPQLEKEIASLQHENRQLRDTIGNKLYFENLVESLQEKVKLTDSYEKELIHLRAENKHISLQLDEWKSLGKCFNLKDMADVCSPLSLRRSIQQLMQQEVVLTSEKAQLKMRCRALEEANAAVAAESAKKEEKIAQLQATIEQHSSLIKRMKKQLTLITWERNDLRTLVDSCQKEYSIIAHTTLDAQNMNKLENLEKVIEGYRQRMETLEKDPSLAQTDVPGFPNSPVNGNFKAERDALLKEKEQLLKTEEQLKLEKQRLLSEIEELKIQMEYRALKGDFDTRDTKILHLKMNPTSIATANLNDKLSECKLENDRLRERIKVLEEGNEQDVTRIVEERVQSCNSKEVDELREKVRSSELQNQRLREVFKVKSQEYREAIYILFGYKVDGLPNKVYRLSSVYAEGPEEYLIFQESESGNMDMLETPFSQTLGDLISLHLTHQHSLPMFLAALTTNLFEKHSMTITNPIVID